MSPLSILERRRGEGSGRSGRGTPSIDPRIEARRREVAEARRRRRRWWLSLLAAVLVLAIVGFVVTRSAALDIDRLEVSAGAHTSAEEVRQASGLQVGDQLVSLDLERAAGQIQALPWVRDVSIERSWGGTVSLAVVERAPVAVAHVGERWLLVDADRRVLAESSSAPAELPIVERAPGAPVGQVLDASTQGAIDVAGLLTPGLRSRVVAVDALDPGALVLRLRPAGAVTFGPAEQIEQKVRALQTVFAHADLTELCKVDVRVPDSPVLTRARPCA